MLLSLSLVVLLDLLKYEVVGRALMIEPPQRSSLWRFHYKTLMNTEDDLLNCGGYEVHWGKNGGKCGVCGDSWSLPQDHDDGGIYASGIIVRSLHQGGYVNVTVEVLNNLLGYFEFRLCPRNSTKERLTHACFENNVLWIEESWDTRYYPGSRGGIYDIHVRLPASVICSHCVFQWKFTTGYRMGGSNQCDCMGCGRQEQFYNCADVEIKKSEFPTDPGHLSVLGSLRTPSFIFSTENRSELKMQHLRDRIPYSGSSSAPDNISITSGTANDTISSRLSTDPGSFLNSNDTKLDTLLFPLPEGSSVPGTTSELLSLLNKTIIDRFTFQNFASTTPTNPTFNRFIAPSQNLNITISPVQITNLTSQKYEGIVQPDTKKSQLFSGNDIQTIGVPFSAIRKFFQQRRNISKPTPARKPPASQVRLNDFSKSIKTLFHLSKDAVTMSPFIRPLQISSPLGSSFRHKEINGNGYKCDMNSKNFYCKGRGIHANTNGIDQWCTLNCRAGNCNVLNFICECNCEEKQTKRCKAIGNFTVVKGMNAWCSFVCLSSYCPPSICSVDDCRPKSGE